MALTPSSPWKLEAGLLRGREGVGGGGRGRPSRFCAWMAEEGPWSGGVCPALTPIRTPDPYPSSPSELEI